MSKYETSDSIKKYTKLGDIKALRILLIQMINTDENFTKGYYENSIKYINENIDSSKKDKIYEIKNNTPMILDSKKDNFTEKDFVNAICNLRENFCPERVDEVKVIGQYVYKNKYKESEFNQIEINNSKNKKLIKIALIMVGIVGLSLVIKEFIGNIEKIKEFIK